MKARTRPNAHRPLCYFDMKLRGTSARELGTWKYNIGLTFPSDGWFYLNPSLSKVRKVNYLAISLHPGRQLWWKSHADEQFKGRSPIVANIYTWAEGLLDDPRAQAIDAYVR